jgi:hypothetical protein
MAKMFLVRVELHQAETRDYKKLHDGMTVEGFLRTVRIDGLGKRQDHHGRCECRT